MKKIGFACFVFLISLFVALTTPVPGPGETRAYAAGDEGFNLVISTDDGLLIVDRGGAEVGSIAESGDVEIFENMIFILRSNSILEYDADGTLHNTITLPGEVVHKNGFAVLPDLHFALFDNMNDKIYFIDYDGSYLATVNIQPEPDNSLQNTDGVVAGNSLILSENGDMQILEINLISYEVTVFKSFPFLSQWLGAIDYSDGIFYVCQMRDVLSFQEDRFGRTVVATVPEGNISGIVVDGSFAYVSVNHNGTVYRVTIPTGAVEELVTGLSSPADIERLPRGTPPSTTTITDPDSGCLATLLYEEDSEALATLRSFRDRMLRQTSEGRELIKLYYLLSPALVKALGEDEVFRKDAKKMVDGIVSMIETL